ncbi:alpha-glucosidase [Haloarculaceae archaeon H-GB2-1]|nr:alpha-glucosidase [Haloarculaceae archaeon H-GB1-1]MEA5386556.1 alpha-glucosidase [Haloarculaceae archaeon H-GB11]MEA5408068.1 alpha-glucosidase [Haloarculaceae archaeon H-GB2-1]
MDSPSDAGDDEVAASDAQDAADVDPAGSDAGEEVAVEGGTSEAVAATASDGVQGNVSDEAPASDALADQRAWWKESVVYQIYPKSFNDSDDDGIGDIEGIIEKLDYLEYLGVDVVWLNPVYESPQHDNGYDVSDYEAIWEVYGDMDDWERLLDGLHERGIRLIMDMVVNHTSEEHAWFTASREDPDGEYGDYYIWAKGDPDEPPNNWESHFGGSAWEYDEDRGEWYLHLYDVTQPDLNWDNPEVREDVYEMMRWWLDKGIDGFRLDVINLLSKPADLPDGDPTSGWVGSEHFVDGPRIEEYLNELREEVFEGTDTVTVGEMPYLDLEHAKAYTGEDGPMDLAFQFDHMQLDFGERGRWDIGDWDLVDLKQILTHWQNGLSGKGWNSLFFENHDQPRSVSRFADDASYRYESATMLATLLLTLQGTPFIYQGQEIGMTNDTFEGLDVIRDVDTIRNVRQMMAEHGIEEYEKVRDVVEHRTRDNARTPMQWDDSEGAGFTEGEPWIPLGDDFQSINVANEMVAEKSVLNYYRDLIKLRHDHDVLVYGEYELLIPEDEQIFAYTRTLDDEQVLVILNYTDVCTMVNLHLADRTKHLLMGNYPDTPEAVADFSLRPYEARVYEL